MGVVWASNSARRLARSDDAGCDDAAGDSPPDGAVSGPGDGAADEAGDATGEVSSGSAMLSLFELTGGVVARRCCAIHYVRLVLAEMLVDKFESFFVSVM